MSLSATATFVRARQPSIARFMAVIAPSFESQFEVWSHTAESGGMLAFQSRKWLESWQDTIGRRDEIEPLAVTVYDHHKRPIIGLPLVRERKGLRRIGFADGGAADYNAPILGRHAPQDAASAAKLWRALLRALPKADLVSFERMPARVGRMVNPFTLLRGCRPASTSGISLHMPESFPEWWKALPRRYRMELGRCSRLFSSLPSARFERVAGNSEVAFEALEQLQRARIDALNLPYHLDRPDARAFYRTLSADLSAGPGVLTTLNAEGRTIAALFGLRHGSRYIMLRIGADAAYARLSPARCLIVRTFETLREEGVVDFDFGLGDYSYKRKLGGQPIPLFNVMAVRSPFGLGEVAAERLKSLLRAHPRAHALAKRLRGNLGH